MVIGATMPGYPERLVRLMLVSHLVAALSLASQADFDGKTSESAALDVS